MYLSIIVSVGEYDSPKDLMDMVCHTIREVLIENWVTLFRLVTVGQQQEHGVTI